MGNEIAPPWSLAMEALADRIERRFDKMEERFDKRFDSQDTKLDKHVGDFSTHCGDDHKFHTETVASFTEIKTRNESVDKASEKKWTKWTVIAALILSFVGNGITWYAAVHPTTSQAETNIEKHK